MQLDAGAVLREWPGAKGIRWCCFARVFACFARVPGARGDAGVLVEVLFCEIDGRVPDVVRGAGAVLRA